MMVGTGIDKEKQAETYGYIKILVRHNMQFLTIDIYRTSRRCSNCGNTIEEHKFIREVNANVQNIKIRRLLDCTNCNTIFNRDKNV